MAGVCYFLRLTNYHTNLCDCSLADLINGWRKDVLELEPVPATEGPNLAETLQVPFTYCWSPALVAKPPDWGSHIGQLFSCHLLISILTRSDVCGFFFREPPAYHPPGDLVEFLNAGDTPIYIGFGSIVVEDPERMLSILLQAVEITGVRAIISRAWSNFEAPGNSNVYFLRDCLTSGFSSMWLL